MLPIKLVILIIFLILLLLFIFRSVKEHFDDNKFSLLIFEQLKKSLLEKINETAISTDNQLIDEIIDSYKKSQLVDLADRLITFKKSINNLLKNKIDTIYTTINKLTKKEPTDLEVKEMTEFINNKIENMYFDLRMIPNDTKEENLLRIKNIIKANLIYIDYVQYTIDNNTEIFKQKYDSNYDKLVYSLLRDYATNNKFTKTEEEYKLGL